ncbi:MAG: deoxyribodipyrimidine photo-lyase [Candidatus Cloacimonetes bacterium]|nr:deoxyribodipyrimidine photo-lyase [Candidatus Cloacimonadota bacterium]
MEKFVLYWMQQAQRVRFNQALNFAVEEANRRRLPLLVCFVVTPFPEANQRHYRFMLQGLQEVETALTEKGIGLIIRIGDIVEEILELASGAELLVTERGFLRIQREWRNAVKLKLRCPFREIDTDTIVPPTVVSDKAEIAARTLRTKINRLLPDYLVPVPEAVLEIKSKDDPLVNRYSEKSRSVYQLYNDNSLPDHGSALPGAVAAQHKLELFIRDKLAYYHLLALQPDKEIRSGLSACLHFGQISPLDIALQIMNCNAPAEAKTAFLEQLIVRRELAVNFIWFTPDYDKYEAAVPEWAQKTLTEHKGDKREYIYSLEELELAKTHDNYWNAAQQEMLQTGYMHNYRRMYWGKKIIEWTPSPQQAWEYMQKLNNRYQMDGRDANSYAGIAWCFGLHDHPWKERAVFGKVRYINRQR